MARTYEKKNLDYWQSRKNKPILDQAIATMNPRPNPVPFPDISYGSNISTASAAQSTTYSRQSQLNNGLVDAGAYQNIMAMQLPWQNYNGNRDYVGVKNAIELSAKAWAGVASVRNAIEVSVEFSDQPIYIKCDNITVKTFFEEWFKAIQLAKLKREFFREYYRSGNVFLYKFNGKFGPAYYKNYQNSFGAKENKLPIKYTLLNPANIFVPTGLTYPYTYVRLMSTYEIERLRNPLNEQDKQAFNSLPEEVKTQIKGSATFPLGIYVPMEADRLRFTFYKKQSYEALAIPMVYPVLADVEWKLTLKKMDMELARKIEHAVLLITTGETGTEWNGGNGINQNNIARLQSLFANQSLGRVLVADYTTEGEWLIPDIKDSLGPEKYKVVNQDIQEGLQSILTGEDKFANAQIKAKIFIQRLEEGQNAFLNDFLMPEIQWICDNMGFRTIPEVRFQKINLQDEAVMARIITQLAQLGILTAEQTVKMLDTGVAPTSEEMKAGQLEYLKERDKGLYFPLVGGSQKDDGTGATPGGRPSGSKSPQTTKKVSPIGTGSIFSSKAYLENLAASEKLINGVENYLSKKYKVKELNDTQKKICVSISKIIMALNDRKDWTKNIAKIVEKPLLLPEKITNELDKISMEYEVDSLDAILLYKSRIEQ